MSEVTDRDLPEAANCASAAERPAHGVRERGGERHSVHEWGPQRDVMWAPLGGICDILAAASYAQDNSQGNAWRQGRLRLKEIDRLIDR